MTRLQQLNHPYYRRDRTLQFWAPAEKTATVKRYLKQFAIADRRREAVWLVDQQAQTFVLAVVHPDSPYVGAVIESVPYRTGPRR